jgi:hypothetical protein
VWACGCSLTRSARPQRPHTAQTATGARGGAEGLPPPPVGHELPSRGPKWSKMEGLETLSKFQLAVLGMNCSSSPTDIMEHLRQHLLRTGREGARRLGGGLRGPELALRPDAGVAQQQGAGERARRGLRVMAVQAAGSNRVSPGRAPAVLSTKLVTPCPRFAVSEIIAQPDPAACSSSGSTACPPRG